MRCSRTTRTSSGTTCLPRWSTARCSPAAIVPARRAVKFLIDAQLPLRLVAFLNERAHDAVHATMMPVGNRSKGRVIGVASLSVHPCPAGQ